MDETLKADSNSRLIRICHTDATDGSVSWFHPQDSLLQATELPLTLLVAQCLEHSAHYNVTTVISGVPAAQQDIIDQVVHLLWVGKLVVISKQRVTAEDCELQSVQL